MDGDAGQPRATGGDALARRAGLDREGDEADPVLRVTDADQRPRVIGREERVNLCGNWFNSLVSLQMGHGTQREDYHRRNSAYRDKGEN